MAHILVVDDTPAVLMLLKKQLEKEGFTVSTAQDYFAGHRAMLVNREEKIDLIIMDYELGDWKTGRDLTKLLRESKFDLPIVLFSGLNNLEEHRQELIDDGFNEVVSKHENPARLLEVIRQLL